MKKKIYLLLMGLLGIQFCLSLKAQDAPKITSPIPVSPNAAALGKYGEVPVGLYTGVPNISIPFFELGSGNLKFPISISYHAGGVKVEETPSWVGLGWNLNAGGTITKQVRGIADDAGGGFLETHLDLERYLKSLMNSSEQDQYLKDVNDGVKDSQQDVFYYNVGGESGKFLLGADGVGVSIPLSDTKIRFGTFMGIEKSWQVITTNGNIYYFLDKEYTNAAHLTVASSSSSSNTYNAVNTWYLTKAQDPSGTREVTFEYEDTNYYFKTNGGQSKYIFLYGDMGGNTRSTETTSSTNHVNGHRLKKIKFESGEVIFNKKTLQRVDLPGDYAIESIEVRDNIGSLYKKMQFHHRYLYSNDSFGVTFAEQNRLLLDSVWILNNLGTKEESYRFSYHEDIELPSRLSFNQDHWGFYNGAINWSNLVATTSIPTSTTTDWLIPGADRNPSSFYSKAGTLREIIYPLGGKTVFEYENNRASNAPADLDVTIGYISAKILADGVSTSYTTNFTVSQGFGQIENGVNAEIIINNGNCPPVATAGCPVTLLTMPDNSVVNINSNSTTFLPIGNYTLTADLSNLNDPDLLLNYSILIKIPVGQYASNPFDMMVGGLRIKKITNYDKNGSWVNTKSYTYVNPDTVSKSSGILISNPKYLSEIVDFIPTGAPWSEFFMKQYLVISSSSNIPLGSTQSSNVGYRFVQEFNNETGAEGKTTYKFSVETDEYFNVFPFAPSDSKEWKRGSLEESKTYRFNPFTISHELIQKTEKSYGVNIEKKYEGLKVGKRIFNPIPEAFEASSFFTSTGWRPITSEIITSYDPVLASEVSKTTTYEYGPSHLQPTKVTSTSSDGLNKQSDLWYPNEMISNANDPTGVYQAMVDNNLISPVIQEKTTINSQVQLQRTNYMQPFTNLFVPQTVEVYNALSNANEIRLRYHQYDQKGNLLSSSIENGTKVNYLWSYKSVYPIAEIKNADYSSIVTTLGATAINDFAALVNPDKTAIDNFIAPLKLALPNAFISTYSYLPLVGMASHTDPKGMSTYYEYDSFGRLLNIKDHHQYIVKNYGYHNSTNVSTVPNWTDTNVKTCEQVGGSLTGNELMQQVDSNPYSPTYNTYRTRSLGNTGNCTPVVVYAKIYYENLSVTPLRTKADIVVRFFSDAGCTVPLSVTGLNVAYQIYDDQPSLVYSGSITANGTSAVIEYQGFIQQNDEFGTPMVFYEYLLGTSVNYIIIL